MLRKITAILLTTSVVILLSGCWDALDINEKDIILATTIDKTEGMYIFRAEIADIKPQSGSEDKANSYSLVEAYGKSLAKARQNIDSKFDKGEYLGAVQTLVFTDELARSGIAHYMYRVRKVTSYRKTVDIVITLDEIEDLYEITSKRDESMGETIKRTVETMVKNGQAVQFNTSQVLEFLSSDCNCFLLPCINVENDQIALTGYSVMKKSVHAGYIPLIATDGLLLFLNDHATLLYEVPLNEKIVTIEVKLKRREIKPQYTDEKIAFDVSYYLDSQVQYMDINDGLSDNELKEVKKKLQAMIKKDLMDAVAQSQKTFKGDYLGFYNTFRISYPYEVKQMDWFKEYPASLISITVQTSLDSGGMLDYDLPKE